MRTGKINRKTAHKRDGAGSGSFFSPAPVQPKLSVNTPGDAHEREADRIADQVTSTTSKGGNKRARPASLTPVRSVIQREEKKTPVEDTSAKVLSEGASLTYDQLKENPGFEAWKEDQTKRLKLKLWDSQPADAKAGIIGFGLTNLGLLGTAFAVDPSFRSKSIDFLQDKNLALPLSLLPYSEFYGLSSFKYKLPSAQSAPYTFSTEFEFDAWLEIMRKKWNIPKAGLSVGIDSEYSKRGGFRPITGGLIKLKLGGGIVNISAFYNKPLPPTPLLISNPIAGEPPMWLMRSLPDQFEENLPKGSGVFLTVDILRLPDLINPPKPRRKSHVQRKEKSPSPSQGSTAPTIVNDVVTTSPGKSLDKSTLGEMENRFGQDFSHVRIHKDNTAAKSAKSINARAYTSGSNIVFNHGEYQPRSRIGRRLLAHELTHVVQQAGSSGAHQNVIQRKLEDYNKLPKEKKCGSQFRYKGTSIVNDRQVIRGVRKGLWMRAEPGEDVGKGKFVKELPQDTELYIGELENGNPLWRPVCHSVAGVDGVKAPQIQIKYILDEYLGLQFPSKSPPPPSLAGGAATPASSEPPFSVEELRARFRLLDAMVRRLGKIHSKDRKGVVQIRQALNRSQWLQALVAASSGVLLPDDQRTYSSSVRLATEIIDRVERVLPQLFKQHEILSSQSGAAPDIKTGYAREIRVVIDAYFLAVGRCLEMDAQKTFDAAEAKAEALPGRLVEVDLKHFENKPATYKLVEPRRKEMVAWAGEVRVEVTKLSSLANKVKKARQTKATNLKSLEVKLAKQQALVELSFHGLAHWEKGLLAWEHLADEGNLIPTAYRSVGRILTRCAKMREAAKAGNVKTLRERVEKHASDADVERFYRGLPLIAFGSRFLVQLGVTLVTAYVTAGLSTAVLGVGGTAGAAGGASLLATAGTAALEAVTFTLVSRGLMAAIPGQPSPQDSLLSDLIWNFGLFFVLRKVGFGVKKALDARGLPALTSIATAGAAFPLLQVYGVLRFRVAMGRWPSDAELSKMTAENIIMLAALTSGMSMMQRLLKSRGRPTALGVFHKKYGWRFEALEVARAKLESRIESLSKSKSKIPAAEVKDLQDKAKVIEDAFEKILSEVKADPKISIDKIRVELEAAGKMAPEGMSEVLAQEIGILTKGHEVGLRGAGTSRTFSYKWGGTGALEKSLRDLGAVVEKKADSITGLRTLTAEMVPKEPPLFFQERAELTPEHPVDLNNSMVVKLLADFSITAPKSVRMVQILLEKELAKNPMPAEPIAKRLSGPVRVVRRYLNGLKASSKDPVQDSLTKLGSEARGVRATPALVTKAEKIAASELVKSDMWLSARTDAEFLGYLGEYLANEIALALATPKKAKVYSGVHFRGDGFVDAAKTKPANKSDGRPMVDTDVVPELDFLLVTEPSPGKFEYITVMNAKVEKSASRALTSAKEQNANALEALEAHATGRVAEVKDKGKVVRYATVDRVVGYELATGKVVELTGKLSAASSVKQETIGPKGSKGYTQKLPFTHQEVVTLMRLVREQLMMKNLEK